MKGEHIGFLTAMQSMRIGMLQASGRRKSMCPVMCLTIFTGTPESVVGLDCSLTMTNTGRSSVSSRYECHAPGGVGCPDYAYTCDVCEYWKKGDVMMGAHLFNEAAGCCRRYYCGLVERYQRL